MDKKRIELIVEALNISDNYCFIDSVAETELLLQKSYSSILGQQALKDSLEMDGDPKRHLSEWRLILKNEIVKQDITNQNALEIIYRIENKVTRNWLLIFLINRAAENGNIDFADDLVGQLEDGDGYVASQCNANRGILRHMLDDIDLKEFKRRLKLCKPSKGPRNRVIDIKRSFMEKYSFQNGFSDTFKVAQDKIFGSSFFPYALYPETHKISMSQMIDLIDGTPELKDFRYLKARVLLKYAENDEHLNGKDFELIFTEIERIEKSYKEEGNRLRDILALDLGSSTENLDRIERCKKLITNPMLKRELGYHEKNVKSSQHPVRNHSCLTIKRGNGNTNI
ncbi:hypothetical protein [Winogradskyella sp.]|uniref:hypothetical protein n=1 Tax=Winogradskyella sp. TaxID=1883156 RepID=UPI00261DFF59|nr:hypothetical protein [Winogradskyella sp.]